MRLWILLGIFAAVGFAPVAGAQQWVPFTSFEGDFRVLMPVRPERSVTKEGSTQYRADSRQLEYYVLRHDPRRLADVHHPREDVVKRIAVGDEEVRGLPGDDGDFGRNEFILRSGGGFSMHRIFTDGGQYYELMVRTRDDSATLDRQHIRDYFASFHTGRGLPFAALPQINLETCATRGNAIARNVCQYVVCLQPGYAGNPGCAGMPRLWR